MKEEKFFTCPFCKPYVPYPSKEALLVHLQREHNYTILDAMELVESITFWGKDKN